MGKVVDENGEVVGFDLVEARAALDSASISVEKSLRLDEIDVGDDGIDGDDEDDVARKVITSCMEKRCME